ncbi:MAG TPA: ribose-phosphate pyrophosphokinase [Spirochaetaceae bacterium]|jgi:ribose-phosphate pyrophosphokinase|nr:ribose-phosphate pyrophosphokinase [Spirochaetaceae bacterium]
MKNVVIVGNIADNPFVEDIAQHMTQRIDYSDMISLKTFVNSEFCPRFILDEDNWDNVGRKLEGKQILLVSTSQNDISRNDLAFRNCLIARAAKDNGAEKVTLLEPDLYFSAQDRGPRPEHGVMGYKRDEADFKKFDGQPFSARLYADLLKASGVDEVFTIHNHSTSVKNIFLDRFAGNFHNLQPADVYAEYLVGTDIVNEQSLVLCAPDKGALPFVREVHAELKNPSIPILVIDKERADERSVSMRISDKSDISLAELAGRDIVVIDDMVRTGSTIVKACSLIKTGAPRKIVFLVTHFYTSQEGREKLNNPVIDEIVVSNTIPQILNRDMQGRLRKKMVVLRISRWIARHLGQNIGTKTLVVRPPHYIEDMSSKNPRWKGALGPLFNA